MELLSQKIISLFVGQQYVCLPLSSGNLYLFITHFIDMKRQSQSSNIKTRFTEEFQIMYRKEDSSLYNEYKEQRQYGQQQRKIVDNMVEQEIGLNLKFYHEKQIKQILKFQKYVNSHIFDENNQVKRFVPSNLKKSGNNHKFGYFSYPDIGMDHQQKTKQQNIHSQIQIEEEVPQQQQKSELLAVYQTLLSSNRVTLFENNQSAFSKGQQKNLIKILKKHNLKLGLIRKLMRDNIRIELLYQTYIEQLNKNHHHQIQRCCQDQMRVINKIYELQLKEINQLYPGEKQSILKSFLLQVYDPLINKIQRKEYTKSNKDKKAEYLDEQH